MKRKSKKKQIHVGYKPPGNCEPPPATDKPVGSPRVFRKTSTSLAGEFSLRLSKIGITLTAEEINAFLVSKIPGSLGIPEFIILDWENEEIKKGVNIVYVEQ